MLYEFMILEELIVVDEVIIIKRVNFLFGPLTIDENQFGP